ncbi:MAG: DUF1573 domain-containing protein [Bacteroidales bacterium]|nr:DUF1573 domain-containing protein [Bacteroidales bacterium]MBR1576949.1 DUF1573 domain-containing protein [Bacteroidales bacterium]
MRKILLIGIAAMALALSCTPQDGIRTIRTAPDREADLGKIREIDGPVTVRLLVRNELSDTLRPVSIHTPCGCTEGHFDPKPVAPGEDEVIEVTYNPAYRPGPMRESVQVRYQDSPVKLHSYTIKGEVIGYNHPIEEDRPYNYGEGLYMSHMLLHYGNRRPGETGDLFFRYGNGNAHKSSLTFDVPEPWRPYLGLRSPGRMKADQRDTLHVSFSMPEGVDTVDFTVQPRMDGRPTEQVLTIRAYRKQ